MRTGAPWFVSNLTLHNDLTIPFVHEEIILNAKKYKLCLTGHSNQVISELFHQLNNVRKFQRIWPEEVPENYRWMIPYSRYSCYEYLIITLQNPENLSKL
jgi:hypothetical protein